MIIANKIRLRAKNIEDARNDYRWQMDPELAELDASPLRELSFSQFLSEYSFDLHYPIPDRRELAIETPEGLHIGNCVFYNIDMQQGETELGILIGEREYWGKGYGAAAVNALLEHIFTSTGIDRVYLKTLDWNIRAQKCFRKCGFREFEHMERNGYSFMRMEIYRQEWDGAPKEASVPDDNELSPENHRQ